MSNVDPQDHIASAYDRALRYLAYRPRSRKEIERYLQRGQIGPEVVSPVVDRLITAGLIQDGEFARFWTTNRTQFSPRGNRALRHELQRHGLDRELIEEALAELPDEQTRAVMAGRKRLRALQRYGKQEFTDRMIAFLARRGFSFEVARRATDLLGRER